MRALTLVTREKEKRDRERRGDFHQKFCDENDFYVAEKKNPFSFLVM